MEDKDIDRDRRKILTGTVAFVSGVGIGAAAVPLAKSMLPSARAVALGAPVEVDISQLKPGEMMVVEWRRNPVWILRRTPQMVEELVGLENMLKDPESDAAAQQPEYAKNNQRSLKPEYFVAMGLCTHLGCSPTFKPEHSTQEVGAWWRGGFHCPCHRSNYDLAGRVYKNSPAPLNLPIPPHRYISEFRIVIGEDPETT